MGGEKEIDACMGKTVIEIKWLEVYNEGLYCFMTWRIKNTIVNTQTLPPGRIRRG